MVRPWEVGAFREFLDDINQYVTDKYGWELSKHKCEADEVIELVFTPAKDEASKHRKF